MTDPLSFAARNLAALTNRGELRQVRSLEGRSGTYVERGGRRLLNLGSNDYLGLSTHPEVVAAATEATKRWGFGSGSARLIAGSSSLHDQLENQLARFKGTEDAVLLSSGYLANLAAVTTLLSPDHLVLSDALNHASLIDAIRLSNAHRHVYRHCDPGEVQALLSAHLAAERVVIATDGVFSMEGDVAPLAELSKLADETAAILFIDDAHGTGVVGPGGRGSAAAADVQVHMTMGTLSKSLGSIGGFIAGPKPFCDLLRNTARAFIFDTALPPAACAAAISALHILEREPDRSTRVRSLTKRFVSVLAQGGIELADPAAAIVPIPIGANDDAVTIARELEHRGFLVPAIRPPSVPRGTSRLRISLMATMTDEQIDEAARAILDTVTR